MSRPIELDEYLETIVVTLTQIQINHPNCSCRVHGLLMLIRQYQASPNSLRLCSQIFDKWLGLEPGLAFDSTD
jgi:hypothetical protein